MKGVSEETLKLVIGIILAVISVFLFYVIFPNSGCDDLARLSLEEVKLAVECASGEGKPDCSKTAVVKLCQESKWSLTGVGYTQAYYGLMVPQYLIYYQKFPTKPVEETKLGSLLVGPTGEVRSPISPPAWSDSYPFERSTIGQRWWDVFPTLTQFKQFFRTKYLQEGCTSEKGLCLNLRGRELNFTMNLPEKITDVKLERAPNAIDPGYPKFHLVAPCFAKVDFRKHGSEIIGKINRASTDASNYCYADDALLNNLQLGFAAESGCRTADWTLDILSLGTKAAVKKGAAEGAKITAEKIGAKLSKEILDQIAKESAEEAFKITGKYGGGKTVQIAAEKSAAKVGEKAGLVLEVDLVEQIGKEATERATGKEFLTLVVEKSAIERGVGLQGISWKKTSAIFGIPCLDFNDLCRGASGCGEALMWPGMPFAELTPEKMKSLKTSKAGAEIFADCCEILNYGPGKNPDNVYCDEPEEIVSAVKSELRIPETENLNLTTAAKYIGFSRSVIESSCRAIHSDHYRTCMTSDEGIANGRICADLPAHTYTADTQMEASILQIFVGTSDGNLESGECETEVKIEISSDGQSWKKIDQRPANKFPGRTQFILNATQGEKFVFKKLKISDATGKCKLDYSSVAIDPDTETPLQSSANTKYNLQAGKVNFFLAPENYSSQSAKLCALVKDCRFIQKWQPDTQVWIKYVAPDLEQQSPASGSDFSIIAGDKIGIFVSKESSVTFLASQEVSK